MVWLPTSVALAPRPRTRGVAALAGEDMTEEEKAIQVAREQRRKKTRNTLNVVTRLGRVNRLGAIRSMVCPRLRSVSQG